MIALLCLQAGGMCFPPNSLPTSLASNVIFGQLVRIKTPFRHIGMVFKLHVLFSSCLFELLKGYPEPVFYDVFLVIQKPPEDKHLLAVPLLNINQLFNGQFTNQGSNLNNWYLTRRLMLVDTLSGREKSLSSSPKVIRVASNINIGFQLVTNTQKGQVYPPLMTVTYSDILVTDPTTQTVIVSFSFENTMEQEEARVKTDVSINNAIYYGLLVVFCSLRMLFSQAHREMDYIVKDKLLFERLVGMEFIEPLDKSIFYN
ncbi:hypothetical protein cypCar_00033752, partial [Cyprinus carpio]